MSLLALNRSCTQFSWFSGLWAQTGTKASAVLHLQFADRGACQACDHMSQFLLINLCALAWLFYCMRWSPWPAPLIHLWTLEWSGAGLPTAWAVAMFVLGRSAVSDSLWPHGPTRLLYPWNFLGKNTGVGCHFLLTQGLNPSVSPVAPTLVGRFFTTEAPGKPLLPSICIIFRTSVLVQDWLL